MRAGSLLLPVSVLILGANACVDFSVSWPLNNKGGWTGTLKDNGVTICSSRSPSSPLNLENNSQAMPCSGALPGATNAAVKFDVFSGKVVYTYTNIATGENYDYEFIADQSNEGGKYGQNIYSAKPFCD